MLDHLQCVLPGLPGDFDAAQHARDLVDPGRFVEWIDTGLGRLAVARFAHPQLLMCLGGHLRQMRHTQDLAPGCQPAQQIADDFRHRPADADVDFVENKRWYLAAVDGRDLDRQADA